MDTCGVFKNYHTSECEESDSNGAQCDCNELTGFQLKMEYFQNAGK